MKENVQENADSQGLRRQIHSMDNENPDKDPSSPKICTYCAIPKNKSPVPYYQQNNNKPVSFIQYKKSTITNELSNSGNFQSKSMQLIIPCKPSDFRSNEGEMKKAKKHIYIFAPTKYPIVHKIASKFGLKEVRENDPWDISWTDISISVHRCKQLKPFQRINHFPGMIEICHKDNLARNLKRMARSFPNDYNFFPKTWCLPGDLGEILSYARKRQSKTYICKPETGCQGKGIFIAKTIKEIKPFEQMICQVYLEKPYLIDGFKFDLRIYALITNCDPLRIFVYNEGLARFATSRYREPNFVNCKNVFMHLTNYAVNKHSTTFNIDEQSGSKRRISTLFKFMESRGIDIKALWKKIDDIIIKTVISADSLLKHSYHTSFPLHDVFVACFELLGFDILLDQNMKPYILEVNHSPSFHTDAKIDHEIKESLLIDTFKILDLTLEGERFRDVEEMRRKMQETFQYGKSYDYFINKTKEKRTVTEIYQDILKNQNEWEMINFGNYRLIYPSSESHEYDHLFSPSLSKNRTTMEIRSPIDKSPTLNKEKSLAIKKQTNMVLKKGRVLVKEKKRSRPTLQKKTNKLDNPNFNPDFTNNVDLKILQLKTDEINIAPKSKSVQIVKSNFTQIIEKKEQNNIKNELVGNSIENLLQSINLNINGTLKEARELSSNIVATPRKSKSPRNIKRDAQDASKKPGEKKEKYHKSLSKNQILQNKKNQKNTQEKNKSNETQKEIVIRTQQKKLYREQTNSLATKDTLAKKREINIPTLLNSNDSRKRLLQFTDNELFLPNPKVLTTENTILDQHKEFKWVSKRQSFKIVIPKSPRKESNKKHLKNLLMEDQKMINLNRIKLKNKETTGPKIIRLEKKTIFNKSSILAVKNEKSSSIRPLFFEGKENSFKYPL